MASPIDYAAKSPEAGADILHIAFAVGATGAVGAIQGSNGGPVGTRMKEFRRITTANPTPVVRISAGTYDIFLREAWLALLDYSAKTIGAVAAAAGYFGKIVTDNVATAAAPKVRVSYLQTNGTAADPTNGDIALVTLHLKKWKPF